MAKSPSDPLQDTLFREVEEDLRREHLLRLWKRYAPFLVVGVVLIVAVVAGYQGWTAWQQQQRSSEALRYEQAETLLKNGKTEEALAALAALGADATTDHRALARLLSASTLSREGKIAEAAETYKSLAEDAKSQDYFRDMARILYALHALDLPETDLAAVKSLLIPLLNPSNPYQAAAREAHALVVLQQGDHEAAVEDFRALAEDESVPPGIGNRARSAASLYDSFLAVPEGADVPALHSSVPSLP